MSALGLIYNCVFTGTIERKRHPFKCLTFGATTLEERHPATGDFDGNINVWDLENKLPGTVLVRMIWSLGRVGGILPMFQ